MIKKISFFYIFADLFLILVSLYMGGLWLLNTQVAFIASMLILFASFFGYKKMVKAKTPFFDSKDFDENLEDKEIIKNTKKAVGTFKFAFSSLRLLSYVFLALAFLYLNRHGLLAIMPFLLGLAILPIATILSSFFLRSK